MGHADQIHILIKSSLRNKFFVGVLTNQYSLNFEVLQLPECFAGIILQFRLNDGKARWYILAVKKGNETDS